MKKSQSLRNMDQINEQLRHLTLTKFLDGSSTPRTRKSVERLKSPQQQQLWRPPQQQQSSSSCTCRCHKSTSTRKRLCPCQKSEWPFSTSEHRHWCWQPYSVPWREPIPVNSGTVKRLCRSSSYSNLVSSGQLLDAVFVSSLDLDAAELVLSFKIATVHNKRLLVGKGCGVEARHSPDVEPEPSVTELASYMEHFLHIPRKMSGMAESMYA